MATVSEAFGAPTQLGSDLQAGVDAISQNQTVVFTKYISVTLPLDGFRFWVRADHVSKSALLNASALNTTALNQTIKIIDPAPTIAAKGSLHYASSKLQEETETYSLNRVVFTSEQPLHQDFQDIGPMVIYIGDFDGVRFGFSDLKPLYRQANLWHYMGEAIYPFMQSQIVDDPGSLDTKNLIVSNSLPLWLRLSQYQPTFPSYGFGNPILPLFPSMLAPPNVRPPYATVHIYPEGTRSLTSAPVIGRTSSHSQLVADRVKITMYGMRSYDAMDFIDCVNQYSSDYDEIGILNMPVIRDEKRTQDELSIIAMKKSVEYEVSYYQNRANDIARQLITEAFVTVVPMAA